MCYVSTTRNSLSCNSFSENDGRRVDLVTREEEVYSAATTLKKQCVHMTDEKNDVSDDRQTFSGISVVAYRWLRSRHDPPPI